MEKDYILKTDTARKIYGTVKALPIVDYHCHLSPREIYEDKPFTNIGEIWLAADHYKCLGLTLTLCRPQKESCAFNKVGSAPLDMQG